MGEYSPNDNYRILDGYALHVNMSNADARTALRTKGYRLSDYANYNSVVMLALIKYADLNFQYCLGMGWNIGNDRQISSGDAILGDDGYNGTTRDTNASIKVMGIMDLYGNVWKLNDATFAYSGYVYVNDDLDNITEWPTMDTWQTMGYKKVGSALKNGYIKEFTYDSQFPWMTFAKEVGESSDTTNPVGDYCWANNNSTMCYIILGGCAWDGAYNGPFYWSSNAELLYAAPASGCLASAFPA